MKKKKKKAINSVNDDDDKCFQCTAIVTLNHEEVEKNPQRISKIKPFVNRHN